MAVKKKQTFKEKMLQSYRLIVYDNNFAEVFNFHLSRLSALIIVSVVLLAWTFLIVMLMLETPIRSNFDRTPPHLQQLIRENEQKLDSIEAYYANVELYLENLKRVMSGKAPKDVQTLIDTSVIFEDINLLRSKHDSILRLQIQEEEEFNISQNKIENHNSKNISGLHFYKPVNGLVVKKFLPDEKHYGIDVVAEPNLPILSVLDGTVTMASWTVNTGYVIQVQHENNIVSVYKHNSVLLKEQGDLVKAGESIAIIGNTGEQTTGPHLHFELWNNGVPVNPEDFILF